MARAAAGTDVYTAIAEPRRREILELLGFEERAVGDLVDRMGVSQPTVSEHLRVLREVDLVRVRKAGRRRLYSLRPETLRPVKDWVEGIERFWIHQIDRVQEQAARKRRTGRRGRERPTEEKWGR